MRLFFPKLTILHFSSSNNSASSGSISDDQALLGSNGGAGVRRGAGRESPEGSIANHYSNDPFHKNWRDSMDKKTKKELIAEYAENKRRPSQHSMDSLEEKRRFVVVKMTN